MFQDTVYGSNNEDKALSWSFKPIHSLPSLTALPVLIPAHCLTRRCSWLQEANSVSVHKFLVDIAVEDKTARSCLVFGLWMCRIAKPQKMRAQHLMEFSTLTDVNSQQTYIERETIRKEKGKEMLQPWQHPMPVAAGFFQYPARCLYRYTYKKRTK